MGGQHRAARRAERFIELSETCESFAICKVPVSGVTGKTSSTSPSLVTTHIQSFTHSLSLNIYSLR